MVPREDGRPLEERWVFRNVWLAALEAAQLRRCRLHDARHTHASLLLHQGEAVKVVQGRLGHADVKATLAIYAHLRPGAQRRAADRLDAALSGATVATEDQEHA